MNRQRCKFIPWLSAVMLLLAGSLQAEVVFETTSRYSRILVLDQQGLRYLSFDGSQETRMSLANPLQGHFSYIEFFHLPRLWNPDMTNALMIGLGGGSIQRAYRHYYPEVEVDTVEIDPEVVEVAKKYFHVQESDNHQIHVQDGRAFVQSTEKKYDAIIIDAYSRNRQGSYVPPHLATKEFFELVSSRLTEKGVLAYNIIGSLGDRRSGTVGAIYNGIVSAFPQTYLFPAPDSLNVVILATKEERRLSALELRQRAWQEMNRRENPLPTLLQRAAAVRLHPPASAATSPPLTDALVKQQNPTQ